MASLRGFDVVARSKGTPQHAQRAPARLLRLLRARRAALASSALHQGEADLLGAQPLLRVLERAASSAADVTAVDHSGRPPAEAAAARVQRAGKAGPAAHRRRRGGRARPRRRRPAHRAPRRVRRHAEQRDARRCCSIVKVAPWQYPSSAPAPPRCAPSGSVARHSQPVPRVPGPVRSGGADGVRACQECPMASGPDGVHLCRDQGRYGRPARPKRLIGPGWPKLGAA